MLGMLRFFLAISVVATHLSEGRLFFHYWGAFAVFGFYLISGYLITRVLNDTYKFDFYTFASNRFLRLFPIYYFVAALTLAVILLVPGAKEYHSAWTVKSNLSDVLGNALLFPFEFYSATFRIVPPTWSVGVEIINYFLLWLFIARSRLLATFTLAASLAYHLYSLHLGLAWTDRYFPAYAAILPFAVGACIFFYRGAAQALDQTTLNRLSAAAMIIWITNLILCGQVTTLIAPNFPIFYYLNLTSLALGVYFIANSKLNTLFRKPGKFFGDLAYPIFLIHWPIGFVISQLILDGQRRGFSLLALSLPPILLAAIALAWLGEKWLEPFRSLFRKRAMKLPSKATI